MLFLPPPELITDFDIELASAYESYAVEGGNIYYDPTTGKIKDADSSITSAVIPSQINGITITSIESYAFYNCSGLTSISIPNSVTSIGSSAFYNCSGLKTAGPIGSGCNYEFGWTTSIPSYAFEDCSSLTSISIPDSVTSIGSSAFRGCSKLEDVYYSGSKEQWNNINIYSYNTCLTNATIHYNSSANGGTTGEDGSKLSFGANKIEKAIGLSNIYDFSLYITPVTNDISDITFTSSNPDVAEIEKIERGIDKCEFPSYTPTATTIWGHLNAKQSGITTITATNSKGASASCLVTVKDGNQISSLPSYNVEDKEKSDYVDASSSLDLIKQNLFACETAFESYKDDAVKVANNAKSSLSGDSNEAIYQKINNELKTILGLNTSMTESEKEAVLHAIYETLIKDLYNEGVNLGKIDPSKDNVKIDANIINELASHIINDTLTYEYGEYKVTINITGFTSANFGTATVKKKNQKFGVGSMSAFVSNEERVIKAIKAYAKELNTLGKSAADEAINQLISSFSSNLGIDEFIKSSVIKKLTRIKPELANKGLGELVDLAEDIGNIFKQEQTISKKNVSANDVYNAVKNISNVGDAVNLPTKLATKAYKTFVNARKKLVANATAYITNQPAPENEDIITGFLKKIGVKCPVDIYVYDNNNNELGNIIDGEVNCNSDIIALDINGDLKNIYLLKNEPINIKYVATDWGLLNLTFEDFSDGSPIGRLNYYDIPLNLGDEITSNDITTSPQSITINSPNEDIGTYEYISANEDAGVTISINAENGSVAGGAKYVKGDYVNLLAIADDGYKFVGWYNRDEFLERASLYEFTAKEDLNLTAKFIEIPVVSETVSVSEPTITVDRAIATNGEYINVSITTTEENAKIYYTIDGTEPTINSSEYTEPFKISGSEATISIKAIVVVGENISNLAVAEVKFMNKEAISLKYGDVDNNQILTATDSAWVLKKALNADFKLPIEKIKSEYIKYADVDGDNLITATDAAIILQKVRNKAFVFPIEK